MTNIFIYLRNSHRGITGLNDIVANLFDLAQQVKDNMQVAGVNQGPLNPPQVNELTRIQQAFITVSNANYTLLDSYQRDVANYKSDERDDPLAPLGREYNESLKNLKTL